MIAFESNRQSSYHWTQKQCFLKKLDEISRLPITASPEAKELLLRDYRALIYSGKFDSLIGGYVSDGSGDKEVIQKPILINAYFCEILWAADQVFYTGEFSFIAGKIAKLFIASLRANNYQPIAGLAVLDTPIIGSDLSEKEMSLLSSLTSSTQQQDGNKRIISFRKTLKQASNELHMPYKEAQIVESNLVGKLQSINLTEQKVPINENDLLTKNVETFIALVSYFIGIDQLVEPAELKNYFDNLIAFREMSKLSSTDLILLAVSIIYYLQINFSGDLVNLFKKFSLEIKNFSKDNLPCNKQFEHYLALINGFNHCLLNAEESVYHKNGFQFIFLNRDEHETIGRLTDLNSKFRINRFVFLSSTPVSELP